VQLTDTCTQMHDSRRQEARLVSGPQDASGATALAHHGGCAEHSAPVLAGCPARSVGSAEPDAC
jgi:hypothetical protein